MARLLSPPPYGFGLAQEDERVEADVLCPAPGRALLCVASGGEVALGMAARGARVLAVDLDPAQLHLTALKHAAALTLEPAEAASFLGYMPAPAAARRRLLGRLRPRLSAPAAAFWEAHPEVIGRGALLAGRFERYLVPIVAVVRALWGRRHVERLCALASRDAQEEVFDAHLGRPWVRWAYRLAFDPRVYGGRGIGKQALAQRTTAVPLGEQYYAWFRAFCTATPARDNWLLQVLLLGRLLDPALGPDYLRPPGLAVLRASPEALRLSGGDLATVLRAGGERFDGFHLSNLGDWMDDERFADLLRAVVAGARPDARILWRELQRERQPPPDLAGRLVVDRQRGIALRGADRFPFYRLVPGEIPPGSP